MKLFLWIFCYFAVASGLENYQNETIVGSANDERLKKVLPTFQFIKFPNEGCNGGTKNGTCFTTTECSAKGGVASGTCANGFGVCCVFVLSCGGISSYNFTFMSQPPTSSFSNILCEYTICQANPAVCRIRLDFTTFNIAGPVQAKNGNAGGRYEVGNCATDTFQAFVPGGRSSPVICGFNSGQHMIVDVGAASCMNAIFKLAATSKISRNWDIKVTQFDCGDQNGGPPGCLQYFTGVTNTFASFNFPTGDSVITQTATHLAYQNYDICIRRESGFCFICYLPSILVDVPATDNQNSFGISASFNPAANVNTNQNCNWDYLSIPAGSDRATTLSVNPLSVSIITRVCGRQLGINVNLGTSTSVCSAATPFKLTFFTDAYEVSTAGGTVITNEETLSPMGTIGFSLTYTQLACGTTA